MSWLDRVAARAGIEPNEQQNIEPPEPEQDSAWKYINAGDISGFADWTNRNMNYRDIPFLGQLVGHTADASIQGVADLAQFVGAEGVGNYLNEIAQEGESRLAPMSTPELSLNYVTDPNGLTSAIGMLLGSMLPMAPVTMLVPEAAALRAGALLKGLPKIGGFASEFAPKAVKWAATGPIEAAMEGGNTERQMLESGASREEANRAKWDAFKGNVALLTATNALEGGLLGKVARVKTPTFENGLLNTASKAAGYLPATAAESALQGYEEGAQQGIQEGAMSGAMDLNHILNPNAWNDEQWENAKFAVAGGLPMVGGSALIRRFGGNTPTASANELLEQAQASTAQKLAADSAPAQAEVATAQPAFGLVSDAATETQAQSGNALPTYDQKFYTIADEVSDTALDADTEARLNILAHDYQEQFGEPLYVTSMKRNGDGSSWHDSGQAFDIAGGGLETNENGEREWLIQRGQALGLTPLDEYAHPSEHATGGHIHFSNHEDGSAPSIGGTQGGAVDVSSLTGGNIAMAISQRTGLPAQFIWAQMAHESANFQSDLARKDHNYAGVKGTDGEYLHFDSDEDFVNYMADYLPEYSNNGIFNAKNVDEYAQALKDGGYFGDTVENYAGDMKNILSRAGLSQSGRSNLMNDKPSFDINRDDETGRKMVADFVSYWSNATDNADDMNELETMLDRNGKFRNTPENRANVREKFGDAYQQFADARMQEEAKKQEAATQAATPSAQKPVQQAAGASPNAPSDLVSMQTPNLDQTANRKADTNAPTNQTQGFTMEDAPQAQAAAQPSARPQSAQQNANQQGTRQNTAQNVQTQTATTQPSTQSTTPERNTQQASTTQTARQANAVETALMHFGINKVNDLERANGNTSTPESMRLRQALQERNTASILSMYPQEAAQAVAPVLQPARPARQQKRAQRKETNATPLQLQQGQNLVTLARQNNVKLPKGMVGALMRGYGIDSATKELAKHGVAVPQQTKGEAHENPSHAPAPAQSQHTADQVQNAELQPRKEPERREETEDEPKVTETHGGRGKSVKKQEEHPLKARAQKFLADVKDVLANVGTTSGYDGAAREQDAVKRISDLYDELPDVLQENGEVRKIYEDAMHSLNRTSGEDFDRKERDYAESLGNKDRKKKDAWEQKVEGTKLTDEERTDVLIEYKDAPESKMQGKVYAMLKTNFEKLPSGLDADYLKRCTRLFFGNIPINTRNSSDLASLERAMLDRLDAGAKTFDEIFDVGRGNSAQNATKKAAPKGGEKSADEIREELIDLAAYAWVDKKFQGKVSFRPSEKLNAKLEELFGHTVDEVFITADDVRHLKNNHSNGEERRGQRSLVAGDVASIYDVVNDFDGAEIQRSDNKGNKTALFWKTSSGKMFTLLIERGKRKAEVKTAYDQNKKETSPMPDAKSSSLNVRNDSAKSPSASSIPQEKTEKQSEKPSDADDFHGYLATKAPNIADTIRTALAKNINPFGGKGKGFMTLKRIVEDYARGDLLYGKDSSSKKGSKYYLGSIDVTKGGYEYYQYLKEHTPEDWKTEIRKMRAESAARNAANRTRDDFVDNKISYEDAVARINAAMDEYAKVDKNTAERDRKWNLERLDSINRDKHPEIEAAEKVAADKAEREAYHGFLDNKTNLAAGNAKKALSVRERRDGQALTRKDYTEQAANDQAYNMEKAAYKGKTQYRLFRGKTFTIVTKTEYDYFNYLRDHAGKAPATNPKESPLTLIKKAEAIGEAQYDGKQSPQDALAALDVIADATDNAHVKERVKKEKADITARVTEEYKTARASIENFASSNGERRPMIDGKSYATLADYMKALREKRKNDLLPDQFDKLEALAKRTAEDMERTAKSAAKAEESAQDSIFGDKEQADRELLEELGINPDEEETLVAPEGITNTAEVRVQLEKELTAELNKISANPVFNPKVYELGVRIAFTYVKDGMNTAKKLIATLNEKFGDAIAPWSPAIVETVRTWPKGVAFDAKTVRALSKAVGAHYEQGTQTRAGIHAEMKELFKGRYDSYAPMIDAAYNGIEKFFNAKEAENNGHGTRPREGADRGHEVQQPREVRGTEEEGQPRGHRGGVPVEGEAEEGRVLQDDGEAAAENAESVGSVPGNEPHHDGDRGNGERGNHELAALRDDQAKPAAEKTPGHDYTIEGDGPAPKTPKQRFDANVEAIKLLKQLEAEGWMPTPAEQSVLAAYSSWGGLTKAFEDGTKENKELRKLLTKDEYEAANRSILDAYFTPPAIVRAIWKGVSSLGFKGGRVLDPSMGVGNFFGCMPESMRKASALTGVEIDDLSSRFANMLYPSADVEHAGFQNAHVADDSCDLVISNVPFSQAKIGKYALHNYFFANGIDKVRPGGLMVFITSQSSLTSGGDAATMRAYLNGHADLIGGFKLPSGVFKGTGTDVATDVLVFQKRGADGKVSPHAKGFTNVMDYTFTRADGSKAQVPSNKYFYDNPGNVLGKKELGRDRFGKDAMNILPRDGQDTAAELAKAMAKLPNVYEPVNRTDAKPFQQKTADKKARADEKRRDMEYFTDGGKLYQNQDGVRVAVPTRKAKAVKAYLGVRESLRTLFLAENDPDAKPSVLDSLRKKLNQTYDAFVKAHGFLNEPKNVRLFGDDPSSGSVLALESDVKLEGKGAQRRVVSAQKAGIFHQRTVQAVKPVTHADNAKDALLASLNQTGKVDVDYMAKLTGKPKADVIRELGDTIYQDPATETYETADEYLSGNVREKLAQAQKAAKKNPTYQRNVDALKKVVPADLVSSEILVNINSPWIPVEDLNAFMEHLTGASATSWQGMTVSRASNGRYVVDGSGYGASKWKPDGVEFRDLIDSVLNNKPIEVAHKDEDGHRIVDQEKTDAANAAADRIRDEFQNWIWSDKTREQRLAKYYNENYNGEVLRTYDGSHLTFPGMNSGVKLRGHQKNVIWRMLQKVNTLIAHCVGAGKTWEMQAAGMEMRRLGIANKPLYCVPNNIVEQFAREFQTLYPNAKLLVLKTGDDLPEVFRAKVTKTEDGRKVVHYLKPSQMSKADRAKYEEKCRARLRALTRIKTEDWDGIIMSHNMFERLPVSGETTAAYIKEEIAILEQTLKEAEARKQRGKNANGLRVRDLQTRLETLKSKLEEATNQDLKAVGIPFEELGIDQIFVDEADMFKNLHFMTTIGDVSGLTNPKSANRSTDMFIKTQWLTKRNGGRGVVFATGTPISNTMAEMYTMMRYLDSAGLKERGVELFDNWIRQYGDIGTGIERKPSGDGYRKVQKVKHFLNMPELTKAFRKFTDVFTRDELIEEDPNITIPKLKNDKRTVIALAPDPAIVDYIKRVVPERIKNMKGRGKQKKGDDNMLALTNDLRKLSMTDKKIDACAEQVAKKYRETDAEHGAQAIFCDMGVPRAEKENATSTDRDANESAAETENKAVYDRLIASLVAHGIPREQIAFAQQAKNKQAQDELFQKVDRGDIRVIIGTTQKMGAGTNFQRHLAAEHHLDAPWRPRDIEQREGRILRQGNGNKEVEIFTYVVKDSFDANMWEKIKNKASIISQAMSPNIMERSLEDADLVTLSYADVESAATGNPYIKQMLDAKADVAKLTNASTQFQKQQHDAERKAKELPATIKNEKNILALIEEDKAARIDTHGDKFQMEIAGKTYDKRADADKALDALPLKTTPQDVGHIGEYRIRAWVDMGGETHAEIVRNRAYPANKLNAQSIERALRDGVDGAAKAHDGNIKSQQQELKDAKDVLKEQNPYTEKLKAAREQQRQLEQKINDYMTEKPQATDTAPTASATPTETEAEPKETFDVNKTPFYISGSYISYKGKLSKETYDALEKLADKDGADKGSFFRNEEDGNFSVTFNYRRTNTKRDTFIRDATKLIEQDKAAQEAPATSNTWREILSAPTKNELAEKIRKHLKSRYLTIGGVNADGTYHVSSLATYKEISDGVVREVNGEWQFGKYEEAKKPYNLDNSLHVATADNRKWFDEHVHVAGIPDAHYRKQTEVNAETETEKKRRELKEVYEEPDSRVKINGPFLYLDGEGLGHAQIRNMRGMLEDLAQGQARSLKAVGGSKMLGVQPKFQYYISNNYSLMMRIKEAIDKEYPKHSQETKAETSNQPSKPTHYEAADVFRSTAIWNPAEGKMMPNAKLGIEVDDFVMNTLKTLARNNGRRGYYEEQGKRFFFPEAKSRDEFVKTATNFINRNTSHVHYSMSEAKERVARAKEDLKREIAAAFPDAKNVKDEGDRVTFDMPNGSHVEIRIHDNMTVTGEEATRARRAHGIADGVTIRVNGSMYTLGRDVVIDLSRKGEAGTSYHEALHAAMDILFDDKAKAALHKKYGSEEKIADAYRKFMLAEQRGGHVPFAKLFRAIRDFFRGLASHISPIRKAFGDAWTAQKAFEDLASGKAWETKGGKRSHGFSLFSVAEAAENPIDNGRGRGDNKGEERAVFIDRFLNEKVPEEGRTRIASDVENGITTYAGEITPENIEDVFDSLHCVKMLRSTFLDKGRMESYDNGLEYAKNMAAYMYGYARRCFENDERIQRQLALRGASLGRPETVRDLNAQGRAGRSNAGTPRNGGQTYKGTSLAKHGNVTALQEVYDQLIDEEYSKHEKHYSASRSDSQDGFSDAEKQGSVHYSITPEEKKAEAHTRSWFRGIGERFSKAYHLKSDKVINDLEKSEAEKTEAEKRKEEQQLRFVDRIHSPHVVASRLKTFCVFYTMGDRAMNKLVSLRNQYSRKLTDAYDLVKDKDDKDALFDLLLRGDTEGKEWKKQELLDEGVKENVADAYIKIRRLMTKAYHMVNNARRHPVPKTENVTQEQLDFIRKSKFTKDIDAVVDLGVSAKDHMHHYRVSYTQYRNYERTHENITEDMLAQYRKDPGIDVLDVQEVAADADGRPLYNVKVQEGPADMNRLTGYIPHFFHDYFLRVLDENGKVVATVGSGRTQRDAIIKGEEWLKGHKLDKGQTLHVQPKVFDFGSVGMDEHQYAAVMGDMDFYRMTNALAKENDMTIEEARSMLDGKVRLKGRHRFFGNALHRRGVEGYETDLNWVLTHYFNSASRYAAMETEFKPKAISAFERFFGRFDDDYAGNDMARFCKRYINDINGNPSAAEELISKLLNSMPLFKKYIIPTFGDRAALTLGNGIATKVSYLTLGLNMSSALLNFTQLMNSAAYIGEVGSLVKMVKEGTKRGPSLAKLRDMQKHATSAAEKERIEQQIRERLRRVKILQETGVYNDIGLDSGSGYDQARMGATAQGRNRVTRAFYAANAHMDSLGNKSMFFFRHADAICRRGTVLAAYEKARKEGKTHAQAIAFAKEVNLKANFIYGAQDAPDIFRRGSILSQLALQFKKYGLKELEVMADFMPDLPGLRKLGSYDNIHLHKYSAKQKAMFWGMFFLMSGLMGVPALDWIDDLFANLFPKAFGTDPHSPKDFFTKFIIENAPNKTLAKVMLYGAGGAININLASRTGLSDVIPSSMGDFTGPTISKGARLVKDYNENNWPSLLRDVSPGMYNLYAAYAGESRGKRGRLNDRYDTLYDKLLRAVGFRSVQESVPVDIQRIISRDKAALTKERQAAQDAYIENPTSENKARLKELGINPKTVTKEAQKKQQTREERMEGSVSKKDAARYKPLTDYAKGW